MEDETAEKLLAEIRAMVPELAREAANVDVQGSVDEAVIDRLDELGMFRTFRPERYGGLEGDPVAFFRAVRLLSRGCMATGWIASLLGAHEWHLALFDERAQEEVWGSGERALMSSCYLPDGTLTPTKDGYRLGGRWRSAAGIHQARWCFVGAVLLDEQGEPVDYVDMLMPEDDYEIEQSWDPTGLRAIAADSVVIGGAVVPEHRIFGSQGRTRLMDPEQLARLAPVHRLPYSTIHTHAVAVPALGAAEGAYAALVADRPEAASLPAVARAAADLHAGWTQLERNLRDLMEHARTTRPHDDALAIRARRDQAMAAERAGRAIDVFLDAAGAEAWGRHHPLQRAWRESRVAQANAANAADDVLGMYGRWASGADISDRWW